MSYIPKTWTTGNRVTTTDLNRIENGIADSSGGFDGIITIYHDNSSAHGYECTIESGTFSALASKINDGIAPVILVKVFDDMGGIRGSTLAFIYDYNTVGSAPFITLNVFIANRINGSTLMGVSYTYINWSADDEVTM